MYYVVKYSGKFGFIKPWTAVRDGETYSQQFLTPSILEGIEKKLFPEMLSSNGLLKKIVRYKLSYSDINIQQEQTQTRGWEYKSKEKLMIRSKAVLKRGVMINPVLFLAFNSIDDAKIAAKQHICLCRNEDVLLPSAEILELTEQEFQKLNGFELRFGESEQSFLVGYNRFNNNPMYGWLELMAVR
jgi:hypothetical protein